MEKKRTHRRDAEIAEDTQRNRTSSLRHLGVLCVSAVNDRSRLLISITLAMLTGVIAVTLLAPVERAVIADPSPPQGNDQDYSKFLHTSQRHASLACSSCHHRNDNSAQPSFPGHRDCIECHRTQYATANSPLCSICHSDLNGNNPPRRAFPASFKENFNMKFDHAQHMSGAARPKSGCVACHSSSLRRGAALSIPASLSAHNQCYTCHTPSAQSNGRDIASCKTCHDQKAYARTPTASVAFSYAFSHAQHSPRQRLNCADCHSYTAGLPQRRQVSSTRPAEHFPTGNNSCASCHNGRRSFGGDVDFKNCRRCHVGQSFRMAG